VCSRWVALPITVAVLLTALMGAAYAYPLRAAVPPPQPVVCVHFDLSKPLDLAKKLIDYAAELGAKYVRFDIWWKDIEPEMGQFNYTALNIYKEIISYMRSKGLQPIAILGTGYPEWATDLINEYFYCTTFCYNYPVSYPGVYTAAASTVSSSIANPSLDVSAPRPQWIRDAIKRSVKSYLKHGGPEIELKTIEYMMKTCPDYYRASAKGYLTADELAEISRKCPGLPIKVSTAELGKGVIYVKPLPQIYEALKRSSVKSKSSASTCSVDVSSEEYTIEDCIQQCYDMYIGAFLNEAYRYARLVASWLGYSIDHYQLGNELNHFRDPVPDAVDAAFIEALGRGVNDGDPVLRFKIVNVIVDLLFDEWPNWENTLRSWLNSAGSFIDIVAIDHYPGTWYFYWWDPWSTSVWSDWSPLDKLISIARSYGKVPAIMETGYPSSGPGHSESNQAQYVDAAFGEIMKRAHNTYIAFLSWYMLWDEPNSCEYIIPPYVLGYCGWGVLRPDFSKKPAWDTLSYWFRYKLGGAGRLG